MYTQTNTYEGVIITNGPQSYALFTYNCGRLEWSGGTIGFNAAGNLYHNHRLSGVFARNIACLNAPVTNWTNVIYQLSKCWIARLMHTCILISIAISTTNIP